ncbi:PACE efflux transporter [Nonlabens tegetincola]
MTGQGHHDLLIEPAAAAPRFDLRPVTRRIIYVGGYEALSVLFTVFVLNGLLGHGGGQATLTAVLLSTTATIWNYAWNTLFERAERRFGWAGRGVLVRLGHAFGYEGGVLVFTVPLVAFMLGVSLLDALAIEASLLVFFLVFTYVYSWAFDKVVGLPESAR